MIFRGYVSSQEASSFFSVRFEVFLPLLEVHLNVGINVGTKKHLGNKQMDGGQHHVDNRFVHET